MKSSTLIYYPIIYIYISIVPIKYGAISTAKWSDSN